MRLSHHLRAALALLFAVLLSVPAHADAVVAGTGKWGVGESHGACVAAMKVAGGELDFRAVSGGRITFALFGSKPLPHGRNGDLRTEAYGFDFPPSYSDDRTGLYFDGDLNARAIAALRLARQVRISVDGRTVVDAKFEGTGFDEALDALTACADGKSGWWGKGAAAPGQDQAEEKPPAKAPPPALNKEGVWSLAARPDEPGVCVAQAQVDDHKDFAFLAAAGQIGLSVSSDSDFRHGRKGKVETDAYSFAFKPTYSHGFMASDDPLDSRALFALRRAKTMTVSIDGETIVDVDLQDTGVADLLTSLADCSNGKSGWWGAGAAPH